MIGNRLVNVGDSNKIMVTNFASKLQEITNDGILTCAQIFKFAKNNDIELQNMKSILKVAGIQVKDCEQTCISLRCKYFK
jgi:hypothetical protein